MATYVRLPFSLDAKAVSSTRDKIEEVILLFFFNCELQLLCLFHL